MQETDVLPFENSPDMRKKLTTTGIICLVLGIAAIFLPLVATFTIQALIAIILLIAGVTHIAHALYVRQAKGMMLRLTGGILYGLVGVLLIAYPMEGALSLTILLAVFFLISGAFKIGLALNIRPDFNWSWMLFNGVISIILGFIIWLALPEAAAWAIGLIVGIELIFSGMAMLMFGQSLSQKSYP